MTVLLAKDRELNIKRSFYKFLKDELGGSYFINYSEVSGKTQEERVRKKSSGYWKWIDLHWIDIGDGIFSISMVQINCNTLIESDQFGVSLDEMGEAVQDALNVNTIPLLDFSDDPKHPATEDNVLIPRFRGTKILPTEAGETVNVKAMDFNVYVWRESVLL